MLINWAACGAAQFLVVMRVHRPALLIFTLFQSNIYQVNVREYPPGIYDVKRDNFQLYDGLK